MSVAIDITRTRTSDRWPSRPRALDLCCGAGGFSAGLHAAGFDVTGVDIDDQPDYPYRLIRGDALTVDITGYDVVVASPPCQRWSTATPLDRRDAHPDVLTPLRERLLSLPAGIPWVMENVPGAPMRDPIWLCGSTLRLGVRRHRLFEASVPLYGTPCVHDNAEPPVPVYGTYGGTGGADATSGREAMGIGWMPWPRLVQAVPPVYGMWIGVQLWGHLAASGWRDDCVQDGYVTRPGDDSAGTIMPRRRSYVTDSPGSGGDGTTAVMSGLSRYVSAGGVTSRALTMADRQSTAQAPMCRHCGALAVSRPATGRWARYCSHACRQAAYRGRVASRGVGRHGEGP